MPHFNAAIVIIALLAGVTCAQAGIVITVNKTTQRLTVEVDGNTRYTWPVSTARAGYRTPNGTYKPQWLARKWYSRQYYHSPMPYSIFFEDGYAIHGSYETGYIGHPASHGCVRLRPSNAAILFSLVQKNVDDTQIIVTGKAPKSSIVARSRRIERRAAPQDNFFNVFGNPFAARW